MIKSWTLLVSYEQREWGIDVNGSMTKDLRRMHRGHHGHPGPSDDHLPERVLGNVWSVLEPGVAHFRDQRCFKMVLVIFGNIGVLMEERWNNINQKVIR
jgi:hypothetical protein